MTDIAELRRLDQEATPGPWDVSGLTVYDTCMDSVASTHSAADAALIVATRNALPELLAKAEAHDALVSALESINQYGTDTLSGNADGPSDVDWYRGGVEELVIRSGAAIAKLGGRDVG